MSWKEIGRSFRNFWRALGKGELLLSIGAHKYYNSSVTARHNFGT